MIVGCYKVIEKIIIVYGLQMGNNFLIIVGVIVLVKVINESESSEMEEFDLMVCVKIVDLFKKNFWQN